MSSRETITKRVEFTDGDFPSDWLETLPEKYCGIQKLTRAFVQKF